MKLKYKERLISSSYQISINFLDLEKSKKVHSIKGYYTHWSGSKMIELPNELVAILSGTSGNSIIIVDQLLIQLLKK